MTAPYTIRIFVPDGDPEGVRIIDQLNWTGKGIVFPRTKWSGTRSRAELRSAGVYILVGEPTSDDDLPTVYVGESDDLRDRIDTHAKEKDFWSWCAVFVSTNRSLNKAHARWLEYALIQQASRAKRCELENGTAPREPELTESETADTKAFLKEILQILPLVGLRVFEIPAPVTVPNTSSVPPPVSLSTGELDTIVVPAKEDGFSRVFLGQNSWYAIRIAGGALTRIKWIAAYRSAPISAVTHYAAVKSIEPYGDGRRYKVVFSDRAIPLREPILFADAPSGAMQGPRYTNIARVLAAKKLLDLFPSE
jgi:hypothetical protein